MLKMNGRLRVHIVYEIIGLDFLVHQSNEKLLTKFLEEKQRKELLHKIHLKNKNKYIWKIHGPHPLKAFSFTGVFQVIASDKNKK